MATHAKAAGQNGGGAQEAPPRPSDFALDVHMHPAEEESQNPPGRPLDPKDVVALGAAVTALISVVGGLAVDGALQQFQRNHGVTLSIAFALVLLAAAVWAFSVLAKRQARAWPVTAVLLFLTALGVGIGGMIWTQRAQERPSISASLESDVLTATATAHNLGTEDRMLTEVSGLRRTAAQNVYEVVTEYFAITGPDAGGTATEELKYAIPKDGLAALAVSATTGSDTRCFDKVKNAASQSKGPLVANLRKAAQHTQPGCAVFFLP